MKTYDLYVQSGPMRKKTYIHVPSLRGCMLMHHTTADALDAAPNAIRTYLGYLQRHGERVDAKAAFKVRVAEERLDGGFLGSGFYDPDTQPLTKTESTRALKWLGWLHNDLRRVTEPLTPSRLAAKPPKGRPIRQILTHVCVEGAYLRAVPGASRIQREADEGKTDPRDALDRLLVLETERLHAMSDEERTTVRQAGQSPWSANAATRRMLEHGWEHYLEICVRLKVAP
jgi:predicted RNase H-like HicB family nuclease